MNRGALLFALTLTTACGKAGAPKKAPVVTPPSVPVVTPPSVPSRFTPQQAAILATLSPSSLPSPPADITNRFADNADAARFGETLFNETAFSGPLLDSDNTGGAGSLGAVGQTGKVACAGCHIASGGYSDVRSFQLQISLGAGWGRRRAPSLLDVGQAKLLMWDGKRDTLADQILGPLENVVEMNSSRLFMAEQIFALYRSQYESLFGAMPNLSDNTQFPALAASLTGCQPSHPTDPAPNCDGPFHGSPGDAAEYDSMSAVNQAAVDRVVINAGKAIAAFERTLTCGAGAFDAWVAGDDNAVSESAQRGALLFIGDAGCVACHSGPFFSDQTFHNVGLIPVKVQGTFSDVGDTGAAAGLAYALANPLNAAGVFSDGDDGRLPANVTASMQGAFRTPTLRCVSRRPAFMHTGQLTTLDEVVAFFASGGESRGFPGTNELHRLTLSDSDSADLVAFLRALDGTSIAAP